MDNISGSAAWDIQDKVVKKKVIEEPIVEKVPYIPSDTTSLQEFINECEMKYIASSNKNVGDALVHLKIGLKLLQ